MNINPKRFLIIGFILVLLGAVMPFLMVIKIVESTYLMNFLSYGASVLGLMLGIIGSAMLSSGPKR